MNEAYLNSGRRGAVLFLSSVLAVTMLLAMWQTIKAQEGVLLPPDLTGSEKAADVAEASPGSAIAYQIVISNSGSNPADNVVVTDILPAELTYEPGSLSVSGGGLYGESGGTITWTGSVNNGAEVVLTFDAALAEGLAAGTQVTNTAVISGNGTLLQREASVAVITHTMPATIAYMPLVIRQYPVPPVPTLNPIDGPMPTNQWTLSWSVENDFYIDSYEIQEAQTADFSNAVIIDAGLSTAELIGRSFSPNNVYYYRVRAVGPGGASGWSEVRQVIGGYRDDFDDPSTGWDMRREDTDEVMNDVGYGNGHLLLEMYSSYDYVIAAPLQPAPEGPYRIETRVQLTDIDNLHSYGIIFGADWNGQPCPNGDFSSCFNHYYRLNLIWFGNLDDRMTMQLKRIDYHDPVNNAGRGVDLIDSRFVSVDPPAQGYQLWAIEVYPDGEIQVFVNGRHISTRYDATYVHNPYFAAFASTDEYTGLHAEFDWYQVSPIYE